MPKKYDQDLRVHAVRMVLDKRAAEGCSQRVAMPRRFSGARTEHAVRRSWSSAPDAMRASAYRLPFERLYGM